MRITTWILITSVWLSFVLVGCSGGGADPVEASHDPADPAMYAPPGGYNPNSPSFPAGGGGGGGDPYDGTYYENYGTNGFVFTEDEDTSTFGMDVDTAAYTIARRYLMDGYLPDPDSVRTEEYINYFDQDYPQPSGRALFSLTVEGARSQFGQPDYHLLRIGVKAKEVLPTQRPPANMVFVVDVSGSMSREDRLGQVKRSLRMLAEGLMEGDKVGLVVYSWNGEVISGLTADHAAIMDAIEKLRPGGCTNACEGLDLGYAMMREGYEEGKINRIILCSDGVANVGTTDPNEILAQVRHDADKGITLTTLGFGMGNYNDVLMEKLANHGDGCYYYIDSDEEAQRLFANGAVHLLMVLASDAKIQVVFNSWTVEKFRLLGYENRGLEEEDFTDDSVDAGEVGAGQTVTALYEIRIWDTAQMGDPGAEVAMVKIRYQDYETKEIEELYVPVMVADMRRAFNSASRPFRFTAAVAEFAEILRECEYAEGGDFESVLAVAEPIAVDQEETEFVELVKIAMQLHQ